MCVEAADEVEVALVDGRKARADKSLVRTLKQSGGAEDKTERIACHHFGSVAAG